MKRTVLTYLSIIYRINMFSLLCLLKYSSKRISIINELSDKSKKSYISHFFLKCSKEMLQLFVQSGINIALFCMLIDKSC
jgi:hypothetical protein